MKNLLPLLILILFSCCNPKTKVDTVKEDLLLEKEEVETLSLPIPPDELDNPEDRADYIAYHFWDTLNFTDTIRSHDRDFMEQNFSNFINLLPYASEEGIDKSVNRLIEKSEADPESYHLLAEIAGFYLYEPNSPFLSEDLYLYFVKKYKSSEIFEDHIISSYEYLLEIMQKNRPGMKAADFDFITRDGKKMTLQKFSQGSPVMLIFYDPDCENCDNILSKIKDSERLRYLMDKDGLKILAVYSGDDKELWQKKSKDLPSFWTVGYEPGRIEEEDLYIFQASPTIYLLDGNGIVIGKDVNVNNFM